MTADLFAAFVIGLLGAGHCLGMCGGIAAALSFAIPADLRSKRYAVLLAYNLGRISSYVAIGLLAGTFGWVLTNWGGAVYLRILAGVLLILLGLYLGDWWKALSLLERAGDRLWQTVRPLGERLMPVRTVKAGFAFGLVWGWLPCGLVYSALAYALASGHQGPLAGGYTMAAFGLGTLPAVFAGGVAAERVLRIIKKQSVRRGLALAYIVFGGWTLFAALQHVDHNGHPHQASSELSPESHSHH